MQLSLEMYSEENVHDKFVMLKKKEKAIFGPEKKEKRKNVLQRNNLVVLQKIYLIKLNSFRFFRLQQFNPALCNSKN